MKHTLWTRSLHEEDTKYLFGKRFKALDHFVSTLLKLNISDSYLGEDEWSAKARREKAVMLANLKRVPAQYKHEKV